ncbi:MAG: hypothetical protein ACR2PO_02235 [Methyloligellaceae bacterium]
MGIVGTALIRLAAVAVLSLPPAAPVSAADRVGPAPKGAAYLDGGASKFGVILLHGRGKHPKWRVVDPLRRGVHARLGYHTLSLQMPKSKSAYCRKGHPKKKQCWRQYSALFPESYRRIRAGLDFLTAERGVAVVYLMGHSMGSRMATAFLAKYGGQALSGSSPSRERTGIAGFIGVGIRNGGGYPLDSAASLQRIAEIPVLDVYGNGGNGKDARHAADRRKRGLTGRTT